MEDIRKILTVDLDEFNRIVLEYLPGNDKNELLAMYNNPNNIFTGYYINNKLIGVCFGKGYDIENFGLTGIAITQPYNNRGRGSRLFIKGV